MKLFVDQNSLCFVTFLKCSNNTVLELLKSLGYKNKLSTWIGLRLTVRDEIHNYLEFRWFSSFESHMKTTRLDMCNKAIARRSKI